MAVGQGVAGICASNAYRSRLWKGSRGGGKTVRPAGLVFAAATND
jgi:hypothetical protein